MISDKIHVISEMANDSAKISENQLIMLENFKEGISDMATTAQNDSELASNLEKYAEEMDKSVVNIEEKMKEFVI